MDVVIFVGLVAITGSLLIISYEINALSNTIIRLWNKWIQIQKQNMNDKTTDFDD